MTDLHTHILPEMDDGAKSVEESLTMLRMQREQGVNTVVLTPHFYPDREDADTFLWRRGEAMRCLQDALSALEVEQQTMPGLILGAEVAWRSDLLECERLGELCIGQTKNMLVELPFTPWTEHMVNQLYELLTCFGITPVIAHLERYLEIQNPKVIGKLLELDVPVQISAGVLKRPILRRGAVKLLKRGQAHLLASDCHDPRQRIPDLAAGMEIVRRKLGKQYVQELCDCAGKLARTCSPCG